MPGPRRGRSVARMTETPDPRVPHHVVIAGAGVAGLEALIALHRLAGDRVETTLVAPDDAFTIRALSVRDPFSRPSSETYDVARTCEDHGARYVRDAVRAVRTADRAVITSGGEVLSYDSLLVAVGARAVPAFPAALTFRGQQDAEAMQELLREVEDGRVAQVAFIVPPGTAWPLPLYELALMTGERADVLGVGLAITIVTPESEPLELFGLRASAQVDDLLAERGIIVRTDTCVSAVEEGVVTSTHGRQVVRAQRVVALPRLDGPRIAGLPADPDGFLPVDESGRVHGAAGVHGAGDGTTSPIKQGGIAAQTADAVARDIAALAGADVEREGFRHPVLRAELLTGAGSRFLRGLAGTTGDGSSGAADHALWWPPTKVAAPHLAPYLAHVDAGRPGPVPPPATAGV